MGKKKKKCTVFIAGKKNGNTLLTNDCVQNKKLKFANHYSKNGTSFPTHSVFFCVFIFANSFSTVIS